MTNIPPSSHGMSGWHKRLADRRAARLAKEAAAAQSVQDRHAGAAAFRKEVAEHRAMKIAGTLPPATKTSPEHGDVGGYDMNGNPV
jgi:hypothetical protein